MVGVDDSGRELKLGGSGKDGEHLFMYQLGPDGAQLQLLMVLIGLTEKIMASSEQVYSVMLQ